MGWTDELRSVPADLGSVVVRPVATASRLAKWSRTAIVVVFSSIPTVLAYATDLPWLVVFTFLPFAVWFAWGAVLIRRDTRRSVADRQAEIDQLQAEIDEMKSRKLDLGHIIRRAVLISRDDPEVRRYFPPGADCYWMLFGVVNRGKQAVLRTRLYRESVRTLRQPTSPTTEVYPESSWPLRWPAHAAQELVLNKGGDAQVDVAIVCPEHRLVRFLGPGMDSGMNMVVEDGVQEVEGLIDVEDLGIDEKQRYAFRMVIGPDNPVGFFVEPRAHD
jgi:hypothetical protein